jgi:hypothetical protein
MYNIYQQPGHGLTHMIEIRIEQGQECGDRADGWHNNEGAGGGGW